MKKILLAAFAVAAVGGWFLFRPDLLFRNEKVLEPAPAGTSRVGSALFRGRFQGAAHATTGDAAVFQVPGRRILRLTNLETSNGPDLRLLLVPSADSSGKTVDLGPLKGNLGDQNYEIPGSVDLARYREVSVWCRRFSVTFGTARLAPVAK